MMVVRNATLSKSVQDLVSRTGGTVRRFDPATGSIKPFK